MKTPLAPILLSLCLLQACENAPVRRQELVAAHPEWPPATVQLIQAGYIAQGMTQDQVKAAWGRPCWTCTGTTRGNWGEAWEYATQTVFFDPNGNVVRWQAN